MSLCLISGTPRCVKTIQPCNHTLDTSGVRPDDNIKPLSTLRRLDFKGPLSGFSAVKITGYARHHVRLKEGGAARLLGLRLVEVGLHQMLDYSCHHGGVTLAMRGQELSCYQTLTAFIIGLFQ